MQIGELDRRIELQNPTQTTNSYGEVTQTWSAYKTVWSHVNWEGGSRDEESSVITAMTKVVFTIRNIDLNGLTSKTRIKFNNKYYFIHVLKQIDGREQFIELETEEKNIDFDSQFSLSFATGDSVSFGDSNSFSFDGSSDRAFSMSIWFKSANSLNGGFIEKNSEYYLYYSGTTLTFKLEDSTNEATIQNSIEFTPSTGGWRYLVATYDGGADDTDLKIYLNGTLVSGTGTKTGTYVAMRNSDNALLSGTSNSLVLDGNLTQFALFNKELSASEITTFYNSGVPTDLIAESNLVGYWLNDEGTGTTLKDSSTNNNSGTLQNNTAWSTDTPTTITS